MILVHCVGEKLEERDGGKTFAVVQVAAGRADGLRSQDPDRLVIAYEPVWAIGTGRNATDAQAQEVHAFIRDELADDVEQAISPTAYAFRYGGSMKPENAKGLLPSPMSTAA